MSSPYHPASNGEAERFVQTFKHALKAAKNDPGSLNTKLARLLLAYRNTPNAITGVSPADLFLKRPLHTRLDQLRPSLRNRVVSKQADQKQLHDAHSRSRLFAIGQKGLVRKLQDGPKWLSGVIVEQTGPVSYRVQVSDQIWRCHADQLLDHTRVVAEEQPAIQGREEGSSDILFPETPVMQPIQSEAESIPSAEVTEPPQDIEHSDSHRCVELGLGSSTTAVSETVISKRYPSREHKPPDRFSPSFS